MIGLKILIAILILIIALLIYRLVKSAKKMMYLEDYIINIDTLLKQENISKEQLHKLIEKDVIDMYKKTIETKPIDTRIGRM